MQHFSDNFSRTQLSGESFENLKKSLDYATESWKSSINHQPTKMMLIEAHLIPLKHDVNEQSVVSELATTNNNEKEIEREENIKCVDI